MPLYIVSTPIGNLDDVTIRAQKTLSQVDVILAEDTRRARILLQHFDIRCDVQRFDDYTQKQKTESIIKHLENQTSIALITDAGTPVISDPGAYLINHIYQSI